MKIVVTSRADADLLQAFQYLYPRNAAAAEALVQELDRKFDNLSHFPFIGRERTSLGSGLRSLVAGTHVIFYKVEDDRIIVVRVLDGRRDIDAEFQR
jgi:toxin ParE1/3/4